MNYHFYDYLFVYRVRARAFFRSFNTKNASDGELYKVRVINFT